MNGNPESNNVERVALNENNDSAAVKTSDDLMAEANAEFDRELQLNIDKEKLTFICDYCGKVNGIKAPRCVRCGKRRPRNEYIKAMSNIRVADTARREYALEKEMEAEEYREAEKIIREQRDKIVQDGRQVRNMEVVRLVEERVSDELLSLKAQEEIRVEQERETAKKMAAREAVLRIIAAEKTADEIIDKTKREAAEKEVDFQRNIDKLLQDERAKAVDIAAEQLVAQRAGIERAAQEQISIIRSEVEKAAQERVAAAQDDAAKAAARQAIVRIVAKEKAADDEIEQTRDAISRAAIRRIEEDREIIKKEESAKMLAEKQGIEYAADERIKAEREIIKKLLDERKKYGGAGANPGYQPSFQGNQMVQPMVIVPYVNSQQPILQYKPNQIYRFVPNTYEQQNAIDINAQSNAGAYLNGPQPTDEDIVAMKSRKKEELATLNQAEKKTKAYADATQKEKNKTRLISILTAVLVAGIAALFFFLPLVSKAAVGSKGSNITLVEAFIVLVRDGINDIFGTTWSFLGTNNQYVNYIRGNEISTGILLPLGLVLACVCYLILFIRSVVRIFTGNARSKGLILPIIALVFVIVAVIGILLLGTSMFTDTLKDTSFSAVIFAALGGVAVLLSALNGKRIK